MMQEQRKSARTKNRTATKETDSLELYQNSWPKKEPRWNWVAPAVLNQSAKGPYTAGITSYSFDVNFPNNNFQINQSHQSLNVSHSLDRSHAPPHFVHMQRNQDQCLWNQGYRASRQMRTYNRKNTRNFRENHKSNVHSPYPDRNQHYKGDHSMNQPMKHSIETSCESFSAAQKKSDISETEKERLRKVEEEKQRIKMALIRKDNSAALDLKNCLTSVPDTREKIGSNQLELACSNTSRIVLTESDYREIGLMNDRKDYDNVDDDLENSVNASSPQCIDDEDSKMSACSSQSSSESIAVDQNGHSDSAPNDDASCSVPDSSSTTKIVPQTETKRALDGAPPTTESVQTKLETKRASDGAPPTTESFQSCARVENHRTADVDLITDSDIPRKIRRRNAKKDEVVIGYIERDASHRIWNVENKLEQLNDFSKIKSMYTNFLRYRRFAKNDSRLYDKLRLMKNLDLHVENPLLNRETLERVMNAEKSMGNDGGKQEKDKVVVDELRKSAEVADVAEVDEFIAIFGDLLDENCSIPEESLRRLGLGSLLLGEEEDDEEEVEDLVDLTSQVSPVEEKSDLEQSTFDPILIKLENLSEQTEPVFVQITERITPSGAVSNLGDFTENDTFKRIYIKQETLMDTNEPNDLNQVEESPCLENLNVENREEKLVPSQTQGHRDDAQSSAIDSPHTSIFRHSNSNYLGAVSQEMQFGDESVDGFQRNGDDSQPIFDSEPYNTVPLIKHMNVCTYIERKMRSASTLEWDPFEVAKCVLCSYGKDLLRLTRLTPALDKSFKTLLHSIKNCEQSGESKNIGQTQPICDEVCDEKEKPNSGRNNKTNKNGLNVNGEQVNPSNIESAKTSFGFQSISNVQNAKNDKETVDNLASDSDDDDEDDDDDDDDIDGDDKNTRSIDGDSIESRKRVVNLNVEIQSAIDASSLSTDCPTRIKCLKVYQEDLFLGSSDGRIIRMAKNGRKPRIFSGHKDSVISINGYKNLLLSGSSDGTVRVTYLLYPYVSFHTFKIEEEIVCSEVKWGVLFVGTLHGNVFRCNLRNFEKSVDRIMVGATRNPVLDLKASREGPRKILIVSARSKPLMIRDARNGLLLRTLNVIDVVYSFAHNASSPLVYCGTRDKSLIAVDLVTGCERRKFQLGKSIMKVVMRSTLLYTAAYSGVLNVHSLQDDKILYTNFTPKPIIDMDVWCDHMIVTMDNHQVISFSLPQNLMSESEANDIGVMTLKR